VALESAPERIHDLQLLDDLLSECAKHPNDAAHGWLYERLDAARTYLLGSMPLEYEAQLEFTEEALPLITDKSFREQVTSTIGTLLKRRMAQQ